MGYKYKVESSKFKVQGSRFKVQGLTFSVNNCSFKRLLRATGVLRQNLTEVRGAVVSSRVRRDGRSSFAAGLFSANCFLGAGKFFRSRAAARKNYSKRRRRWGVEAGT
jgi:hypothetical protein